MDTTVRKMSGDEFDTLVDFFDGMVLTRWLSEVHEQLKDATGSWDGLSVLDVGCGTGRLLLRGADEAVHMTGIDLSVEMINASIENTKQYEDKTTLVVGDACALPFSDNQYDMSLSTCVLFLLPEPELGMKEMVRVTKSNGKLVLLNPASKMSDENANAFIEKHDLNQFETKALKQWAKVSTRRHRYTEEQLDELLFKYGANEISHYPVLDGLALITIAMIEK